MIEPEQLKRLAEAMGKEVIGELTPLGLHIREPSGRQDYWSPFRPAQAMEVLEWLCREVWPDSVEVYFAEHLGVFFVDFEELQNYGKAPTLSEAIVLAALEVIDNEK